MIEVIVPYTQIRPLQKRLLESYGIVANYCPMTQEDSYWNLLADIWAKGKQVIIVEHDVLPWPGAIEELFNCPAEWCGFSYRCKGYTHFGHGLYHTFGCTKLGARLMEELPDIWQNVKDPSWRYLDSQLLEAARLKDITPHPHRPNVIHLHGLE